MANGSILKRVQLTEISLTTKPANVGSLATLEVNMNEAGLEEKMNELRKWATNTSDNWHTLIDAEIGAISGLSSDGTAGPTFDEDSCCCLEAD